MPASRGSRHNDNYLIQIFNGRNNTHCAWGADKHPDDPDNVHVSGILATFHPDVSLSECPVLATPAPPTIVQTRAETDPASPAYVTAASGPASLASLVMVGAGLWVLRAV